MDKRFRGLNRYQFAYDLLSEEKKRMVLLEVGAGYYRNKLSESLPKNFHYTSFDISKEYGRQDYYGDISDGKLPFEDNTFDVLVCFETLEHAIYPRPAMEEFKRVLKLNGMLIISLPNEYNFYLRLAYLFGLKMRDTDSGFDVVKTRGHVHRPRVKDIKNFVSDYFFIRQYNYYWNSTKFKYDFFYYFDKIINVMAKIYPNLFARGVIVVAINAKLKEIK
jgi:SAM-dependent methyltransferase